MTWVKKARSLARNDLKMPSIVFPGVCLGKYQLWRCQLRERIQDSNWLPRLRNVPSPMQTVWRKWTSGVLDSEMLSRTQVLFNSPFSHCQGWCPQVGVTFRTSRTRREVISSHYSNLGAVSFNLKSIANFLSSPLGYFGVTSSCQTILWSGSGITPGSIRFTPYGEAVFSFSLGWCLGWGGEGNQKQRSVRKVHMNAGEGWGGSSG